MEKFAAGKVIPTSCAHSSREKHDPKKFPVVPSMLFNGEEIVLKIFQCAYRVD
jgi:hypothetical protein